MSFTAKWGSTAHSRTALQWGVTISVLFMLSLLNMAGFEAIVTSWNHHFPYYGWQMQKTVLIHWGCFMNSVCLCVLCVGFVRFLSDVTMVNSWGLMGSLCWKGQGITGGLNWGWQCVCVWRYGHLCILEIPHQVYLLELYFVLKVNLLDQSLKVMDFAKSNSSP